MDKSKTNFKLFDNVLGNNSVFKKIINLTSTHKKVVNCFQNSFYNTIPKLETVSKNFDFVNKTNFKVNWIREISKLQKKITELYNLSFLKNFNNKIFFYYYDKFCYFTHLLHKLKENPELQYVSIVDLEILSLETSFDFISDENCERLNEKNELINKKIDERLKKLNLIHLWQGAEFAINTDIKQNPDKIRHCVISLRTLFEYVFEKLLVPNSEIKKFASYNPQFAKLLKIKPEKIDDKTKINKPIRLKYLNYRINFGILEEFAENDINFILNLYKVLSSVHQQKIEMNDRSLRILKIKTGILIWLFLDLYELLKETNF